MTTKGSKSEAPTPVESLSFEAALKELEQIVDDLDKGEVALERSIEAYARGTALRLHCEQKLEDARLRVEQIANRGGGTEPFAGGTGKDDAPGGPKDGSGA